MMPSLLTLAKRRVQPRPRYTLESIYFVLLLVAALNGVNCQGEEDIVDLLATENDAETETTTEILDEGSFQIESGPVYKSKLRFLDDDDKETLEPQASQKLTHPVSLEPSHVLSHPVPVLTYKYRLLPGSASYYDVPQERVGHPAYYAVPDYRHSPTPPPPLLPMQLGIHDRQTKEPPLTEAKGDDDKKDVALHFKYRLIAPQASEAKTDVVETSTKPSAGHDKVYAYSPLALESQVVNSLPSKSALVHTLPPYKPPTLPPYHHHPTLPPYQPPRPFYESPHYQRPFIVEHLPSYEIVQDAKFPSKPKTVLPPPDIAYVSLNDLSDRKGRERDLNGESEIHASSKISSNHTKEGGVEALASDQEKPQQPESNLKENETINKVHALEIAPTLAENPDIKIEEPNSVIKTEDIKIEEPSPVFKTERIKIGEPNSAIKLEDIKIEEPNSVIKPKNAEVEEPKPVIDAIEFSDFVRGKKKFATKFDIHNDRKARKTATKVALNEKEADSLPAKEDQKRPNLKYDGNSIQSGYKYEYKVTHDGQNYGHYETSNGGRTEGQYEVPLPDGRVQIVHYYADSTGFHPDIAYTL